MLRLRGGYKIAAVPVLGARGLVSHGAGRTSLADGVCVLPRTAPPRGRVDRSTAYGGQLATPSYSQRHQGELPECVPKL